MSWSAGGEAERARIGGMRERGEEGVVEGLEADEEGAVNEERQVAL